MLNHQPHGRSQASLIEALETRMAMGIPETVLGDIVMTLKRWDADPAHDTTIRELPDVIRAVVNGSGDAGSDMGVLDSFWADKDLGVARPTVFLTTPSGPADASRIRRIREARVTYLKAVCAAARRKLATLDAGRHPS